MKPHTVCKDLPQNIIRPEPPADDRVYWSRGGRYRTARANDPIVGAGPVKELLKPLFQRQRGDAPLGMARLRAATTFCVRAMFVLGTCLMLSDSAGAATYWVSPAGAVQWAACRSRLPLSGSAACSLKTAMSNAGAGDTVYFRAGTYTVTGYESGISPVHSGTSVANRITFSRYLKEVPVITGASTAFGISLSGKSYIKIDGFMFQDIGVWAYIIRSSSYNEITNCTFLSTTSSGVGTGIRISGTLSCPTQDCWNTHNWIHGNTFSKRRYSNPCGEVVDLLAIGNAGGSAGEEDNYNTIEDNVFSYASHTNLDNFGRFNVIRNNISHNEPWITGCTNHEGYTSTSPLTIGTGTQTLITQTGLSLAVSQPIGIVDAAGYSRAMSGKVKAYDSSSGVLAVNITNASGAGTSSNWILSQKNVPYYDSPAYNGLFGHRNFHLSNYYARDGTFVLLEGNRLGYASNNPGNGGPMNLDAAAPKNIIRYNYIFGGMSAGMYFKYATGDQCEACGGILNRVYNNTIYHNGYGYNWRVYGNMNVSYGGQGIAQWNAAGTGSTGNVIKNNIVYDNKEGDICVLGLYSVACSPKPWDTVINNWTTANGDPKFVSADLSDPTSQTRPNLGLQPSSSAIDGGTYLTQAVGSGINSTALVAGDALYFQDGTWGSGLARGVTFFADWIAIGTVADRVQISSINYATNTITLASPATWSDGAKIWLYKKSDGAVVLAGGAPDFGASEFGTETRPTAPANLRTVVR